MQRMVQDPQSQETHYGGLRPSSNPVGQTGPPGNDRVGAVKGRSSHIPQLLSPQIFLGQPYMTDGQRLSHYLS